MRLKDKVAIVTGAGSGFGAGIARRFAEEGARVIVNDIDPKGQKIAQQIGAEFVQADVTKGEDWAKLVRAAGERLDIVVNNAGWTHRNKPYLEVTEAEFDRVYAVNVKSIYLSALHAVPVFRKRGGGCFVNIASTAGVRPRPGLTVYNSSKGAVIVMSKSMAGELGPDRIRVNCVSPGFTHTDMTEEAVPPALMDYLTTRFDRVPMRRLVKPEEIAAACAYLASDDASAVTGIDLTVDCGLTANWYILETLEGAN